MLQKDEAQKQRKQEQINYPSDSEIKRFVCLLNWVLDNRPADPEPLSAYQENKPNDVGLYQQISNFLNYLPVKAQQHALAKKIMEVVENNPKNFKFSFDDQKPQSFNVAQKEVKAFAAKTFSATGGINRNYNQQNLGPWPEYDCLRYLAENSLWNPLLQANQQHEQRAMIIHNTSPDSQPDSLIPDSSSYDNMVNPYQDRNGRHFLHNRGAGIKTVCFMIALALECQAAAGCGCVAGFLVYYKIYHSNFNDLGIMSLTSLAGIFTFIFCYGFLAALTSLIYSRARCLLRDKEVDALEKLRLNYNRLPDYGSNSQASLFAERQSQPYDNESSLSLLTPIRNQ